MRYLLVGNYGAGNLGDEALKEYFLRRFPEIDWMVISASPSEGEYVRLPLGFRSFFAFSWIKTLFALRKADGLVFGGGSLFTDVESVFACVLWWWHGVVSWWFGKPIFLAFQGIGPLRTSLGERCTRWVLRRVVFLSVRDDASLHRVQALMKNKKVILTFDPVLSLFEKEKSTSRSHNIFTIIPRKNSPASFWQRAQELLREGQYSSVTILSMERGETLSAEKLFLASRLPIDVRFAKDLDILANEVITSKFVLTQRYHGALVALALGIPFEVLPQEAGDKLAALEEISRLKKIGAEELRQRISVGEQALREALQRLR